MKLTARSHSEAQSRKDVIYSPMESQWWDENNQRLVLELYRINVLIYFYSPDVLRKIRTQGGIIN